MEKIEKDGIIYFPLYVACPTCREKGITTTETNWFHENCEGQMLVGDNAHFLCEKCGEEGHIREFVIKCQCCNHSENDINYICKSEEESMLPIANVIGLAGQMVPTTGQEWLFKFVQNLGEW